MFPHPRWFGRVVLVLWLALLPQALVNSAPAATAGEIEQAIAAARAAAEEFIRSPQGAPGVAIAVALEGRIVWSEGFGFADLEQRVPLWPHAKMRIGSVSKSLTSAALALLYEQGKVDLDAPVQKYVPSFPEKKHPITVRQVGGHLSGIRHYDGHEEAEMYNMRHFDTVLEGLSLFANDPLLFPPGEQYHYSSHGWNLISAVVEGAAGRDYLSYMQENVFNPLGMRQTAADLNAEIIPNRARFYVRGENGRWINARYIDNSYKWAGGGFLSTAEDLVRFGWGIIHGDLLKPATVKVFTTSQSTNDGKQTNYGIGWQVSSDDQGRRQIGHGGGSVGGASRLAIYPDQGVVLAMIINTEGTQGFGELAGKVAESFLRAR